MVSYSFLVNDSAFSNVILQQGIRRGEPALPYIVILYGELLSVLYCQAQESGLMTSIKLTRHFMAHLNTTRLSVSSHSTRKYCKNAHFRSCVAHTRVLTPQQYTPPRARVCASRSTRRMSRRRCVVEISNMHDAPCSDSIAPAQYTSIYSTYTLLHRKEHSLARP